MNFESLLDCQERGIHARILGLPDSDNPYGAGPKHDIGADDAVQLHEAWAFGWAIEDTMRHIDTGIYGHLRVETALAGHKTPRT